MAEDWNVVATLRIMPKSVDVNLEDISEFLSGAVAGIGKLHKTGIRPIAFGLNYLEAIILLNDDRGGIDQIEDKIKRIKGVSDVETVDVTRL